MANDLVQQVEIQEYYALVRDAARYRFLRDSGSADSWFIANRSSGVITRWNGDEADKMIDAALSA